MGESRALRKTRGLRAFQLYTGEENMKIFKSAALPGVPGMIIYRCPNNDHYLLRPNVVVRVVNLLLDPDEPGMTGIRRISIESLVFIPRA